MDIANKLPVHFLFCLPDAKETFRFRFYFYLFLILLSG